MLGHLFKRSHLESNIITPQLYNELTFYKTFEHNLASCQKEIIIESPFLTKRRVLSLLPILQKAKARGVIIVINTRDPSEHDDYMKYEAEQAINFLLGLEITILFTGKLHRKLAIIDRKILWEGSLNILSQNDSCEIMQKTDSKYHVQRIMDFTGLNKFVEN